jgi:hypothetical protein
VSGRLSLWRIHADLLTARLLLAVAPGAAERLGPEDHRFLAERHARLAVWWRSIGWAMRSRAHEDKAALHWRAAGADDPPPAVAVGLPRPWPSVRVDARGRVAGPRATIAAFPDRRSLR